MNAIFTRTAIAAVVAMSAFAGASQASAGSVDVDIRIRSPKVVVHTPRIVVRKPVVVVRKPVVIIKPAPVIVMKPGRCAPGLALTKAMNNGLNKVAISHIGPNKVTVSGRIRGAWAKISFANVRGCPRF